MGNCCKRKSSVIERHIVDSNSYSDEAMYISNGVIDTSVIETVIEHNLTCHDKTKISYMFDDIFDVKHSKYMNCYATTDEYTFWGIGIENESYLMLKQLRNVNQFKNLKHVFERYSVDYYKNYKWKSHEEILNKMASYNDLTYPMYINAHTFLKMDSNREHKTKYDVHSTSNPAFTQSIHDFLMENNTFYRDCYDKSIVFDGDTVEFITQNFYNTTVDKCINELSELKNEFLREINPYFIKWEADEIVYPDHNYGFVTFHTTHGLNLGICNNGTYHINITLPTLLKNGNIVDKSAFASIHLNYIRYIQIVEPLLSACYGTPDILSLANDSARYSANDAARYSAGYSVGSLRLTLSRYISLQTYDTSCPLNGKLLVKKKSDDVNMWYNNMEDTPYIFNDTHGYDINFNKFKNHGLEIRLFDWFPIEYVKDVLNFLLLLGQHSLSTAKPCKYNMHAYQGIIKNCLQMGFKYILSMDECNLILSDLMLPHVNDCMTACKLLQYISDKLYAMYREGDIIMKMSPDMVKPVITNYNLIAFNKMHYDLYKKNYSEDNLHVLI
jgi:hypothetical protein